ncbi:potassium/sodium efflux P-type ATPase [Colletotrichum graminicola]|uniref:P-type Na(+) transporter n=1 Tax=Colletotrichum graminicola (strain M1.001 / M2 / FGSC 10212) TaxID=645133 RepID=E3QZG2_COLGM|nr:potassium/sodium efflux P-type ATPase [Colletotrichum graminicola M1.001]EFQ36250.1 potassium/sodium efflux P-type ATPase [Colletotrichum graminicola M1.001]WDK23679.1 potassium/sodium efflux P-type ATPase [Colletotrichum graminicola]
MARSKAAKPADTHVSGQSNKPLSQPAHALSYQQLSEELRADTDHGLSAADAKARLDEYGRNDLGEADGVQPFKIVVAQVANAMTMVLILAMAVSFGIGSWIEGGVITFVILLNVVVGFFQEFSAEKTMDSLRSLSSPTASVVRDGEAMVVPSGDIVPGDLVEIKTGDTIPADVRLIEAVNFETDEALLTGESLPVRKNEGSTFPHNTGPGDRLNVAYSSSNVTKGRAKGIVFATGVYTEIGAIASALRKKDSKVREVKRKPDGRAKPHRYLEAYTLTFTDAVGRFLGVNVGTPLQRKLSKLAMLLFGIAIVCAIIVLGANKFEASQEVIIYAVATGLSMIPASLVVVLTITMAAGTKRMVKRNVIVRNLKSLEALGAVTDICSDKTGTLTQGKMLARGAWLPGMGTYTVENATSPLDPTTGDIRFDERFPRHLNFKKGGDACGSIVQTEQLLNNSKAALAAFLQVVSLANLATISKKGDQWVARGDPTEIAIQVFASRFGWNRLHLTTGETPEWSEIAELPFDSDVKRMSVIMKHNPTGEYHAYTKGAVERVIQICTKFTPKDSGELADVTPEFREEILRNMEALAGRGLRVLALASKPFDNGTPVKGDEVERASVERDLVFRGLVGLYDPPRPESAPAVRQCHEAGISVHMLTGDHPETAKAIAVEVGILPSRMERVARNVADAMVMTASQFDALTDEEVDRLPVLPLVIARCAPSTKVRMIEALHRRKRFCAMTGDGVNDSPSLRRADVGIAMGQSGSDVAKDASDIVLTDDNFASIVAAIEEGRRIFDNIQKFVLHVLAENIAQAGTLLVGLTFKDARGLSVFPLAPVEIVWIIMATSGMPDMGLGFERAVPDIMRRPPQSLKTGIFTAEFLVDMVVYGLWITALCLSSFSLVVYGFGDGRLGENCNGSYNETCDVVFRARATTFACLTWFALFLAWEMVDMRRSLFRMQPGSKKYFTQWMIDVWRNKFLFWAIIAGFVTLFPLLYIPVINTEVFKHKGISWEWAVVFIAAALFFGGVESWKWAKRVYFRKQSRKTLGVAWKDMGIEQRVFGEYLGGPSDDDHHTEVGYDDHDMEKEGLEK